MRRERGFTQCQVISVMLRGLTEVKDFNTVPGLLTLRVTLQRDRQRHIVSKSGDFE